MCFVSRSEDDFGVISDDKFKKWKNGGGVFHESACIDSTAFLDVGAVVHSESVVGSNVRIGSGTVVGFGFYVDGDGKMIKKPQLNVIIGNNVEIGANTCIDRGSWRDTVIGDNSKIDNLVQIGHNVVIGKNCMLCGQAGIAGSATIGDYVTMGGRAAVRDHVSIASKPLIPAGCIKGMFSSAVISAEPLRASVILVKLYFRASKQSCRTTACFRGFTKSYTLELQNSHLPP
ncbi:variant 3 [Lathyrus oleraceus]|uniref:Variant 3 n=1 Tax=Pisum sativum TaxID=3888 RepID=A0A9D4Y3P9_PEA|nr:variant 3 [Pisum sativum]